MNQLAMQVYFLSIYARLASVHLVLSTQIMRISWCVYLAQCCNFQHKYVEYTIDYIILFI